MNHSHNNELLIASVTPQNLERGVLWFSEHAEAIARARLTNPWWQNNVVIAEKNLKIKLSEFSRKLLDLGYERAISVHGKGVFAVRGGLIEIWPINTDTPYLIEFVGNTIGSINLRRETTEKIPLRHVRKQEIGTLAEGSFIVHEDHGIGVFRGIAGEHEIPNDKSRTINLKYYTIEYAPARAGGPPDTLFVPTDQQDRLTPYVGFETPRIHRLGGSVWHSTKRKAREDVEKLACELLALYAKRHTADRAPYIADTMLEETLRETFPYQETADQGTAEKEIFADLESAKPMDRILCGDVGFGKTELAIRAALRVISSGLQVAVLAPTTILAAQHYKTFTARFDRLPVRVAELTRITPRTQEKQIISDIHEGRIDCIIGTHRLLSRDILFKNLGMVVIDEEQRFGVKQKEHFKELRADIDILSLSATPIPRTLQFALARLRAISLLKTAPPERLPIQTFVLPYKTASVRGAITRELARGGQVYILHNRIETIGRAMEKIKKIARHVGVMHGRMDEYELIRTMERFRNRELDVLVATTIIENGLDISSANTLIVEDATRLGLAEAHQLRGRVGRGNIQAFAYFLYRPRHLTKKAADRLTALQEYTKLGAGYDIAMRDVEIRGAGNILGSEQSGAINKIGLNLYCQMLAEAVEEIQQTNKILPLDRIDQPI